MTDLNKLARKFGYPMTGAGFDVGLARVSVWERTGELCVSTSHQGTSDAIWNSEIGSVVYDGTCGRLTVAFPVQRLGLIISAIEEVSRS